jgi:hypothetical protein
MFDIPEKTMNPTVDSHSLLLLICNWNRSLCAAHCGHLQFHQANCSLQTQIDQRKNGNSIACLIVLPVSNRSADMDGNGPMALQEM